jgi:hypothetical protein
VFSEAIPAAVKSDLAKAQEIRNQVIHGKVTTNQKRREAIYHSLEYMKELGKFVYNKTKKNPYGDLRGLRGKKYLLPAKSTFWMLKGFGLSESVEEKVM